MGEIFCRLNTFSNEDLVRRPEEYGAEGWLSDIVEWIWYTNAEHFRKLKLNGRLCSLEPFYPRLSRDLGGLPIRNFYFDGTQSDLDRDLGVYLELARGYRKKKEVAGVVAPA